MSKSIFDYIVIGQDKTLTGSWKPFVLFILVFVIIVLVLQLNNYFSIYQNTSNDQILTFALQGAILAIIINFITGKLFASRMRMYKNLGFSKQRAKAQSYANSRMGHMISALGIA